MFTLYLYGILVFRESVLITDMQLDELNMQKPDFDFYRILTHLIIYLHAI